MMNFQEYVAVVEHAPIMIWRAGVDGECNYFNQRWLRFRGRSMEQEAGDGWTEGVHPDDLNRCRAIWRAHLSARVRFEMEYRLQRYDGEYRWIHHAGMPLYDGDTFCGFVGSCIEVSQVAGQSTHDSRELKWKRLTGTLSMCSWCHRIRDDAGDWEDIGRYLAKHASISFSHGICPECLGSHGREISRGAGE